MTGKVSFWDGTVTVPTIGARNAITRRRPGMKVVVADAIADPNVGIGRAIYEWDGEGWILIGKSTSTTLNFTVETKLISNGQVTADNVIKDGVLFISRIVDANNVIQADIIANVSGAVIYIGTNEFDGLSLHYSYAYGTLGDQITESLDSIAIADVQGLNTVLGTKAEKSTVIGVEQGLTGGGTLAANMSLGIDIDALDALLGSKYEAL